MLQDKNEFQDIYDGRLYQVFLDRLDSSDRHQYLTVSFNTDGAPLYESFSYSMWPIFFEIHQLPFHVRTTELIVVGLWFRKNKSDMNVFLDPFVENMNRLLKEGVECNLNGDKVTLKVYPLVSLWTPLQEHQCKSSYNSMANLAAIGAFFLESAYLIKIKLTPAVTNIL